MITPDNSVIPTHFHHYMQQANLSVYDDDLGFSE
jgi:hypothetical protein